MIVLTWKPNTLAEEPTFYFSGDGKSWVNTIEEASRFENVRDLLAFLLNVKETRSWFEGRGVFELWTITNEGWVLGQKLV